MSGTVAIDDTGAASGGGTALALYNSIRTYEEGARPSPDPGTPDPDWDGTASEWRAVVVTQSVKVKRSWARTANAHADILGGALALALLAAQATTLATPVDTPLSFPVRAGEVWHVSFDALLTCGGAAGVKLGVNAPSGSTVTGQVFGAAASAVAFTSAPLTAAGTPVGAFAASGASRAVQLLATITVIADGVVTLQFGSVTATQSSTIQAGACLRAQKVVGV